MKYFKEILLFKTFLVLPQPSHSSFSWNIHFFIDSFLLFFQNNKKEWIKMNFGILYKWGKNFKLGLFDLTNFIIWNIYMSTTLRCKNIGIRKSEFVAKTQFCFTYNEGKPMFKCNMLHWRPDYLPSLLIQPIPIPERVQVSKQQTK